MAQNQRTGINSEICVNMRDDGRASRAVPCVYNTISIMVLDQRKGEEREGDGEAAPLTHH